MVKAHCRPDGSSNAQEKTLAPMKRGLRPLAICSELTSMKDTLSLAVSSINPRNGFPLQVKRTNELASTYEYCTRLG